MSEFTTPEHSLTFIGNATTLIRCAGFTLLTDPNFLHAGQRVHLGYGLWSKRLTDPALSVADLPPLDAVVLSHMHGDHFDRVAQRELDKAVPILTTPHAAKRLHGWGFRASSGLDTWQSSVLRNSDGVELTVTSLPGRHAFGVLGALLPPVMGSLLEFREAPGGPAYRVYLTGDTLMHDGLRAIGERFPEVDVGLLHLGGTRVFGQTVTMDGRQGAELLTVLALPAAVPIHYDDYKVFTSPLADFLAEAGQRAPATSVLVAPRGVTIPLPARP